MVRGAAIGVARVTRDGPAAFVQSDVEFLLTLCGQAAIAIANARLFESLEKKQAEVEELLRRVINTSENERLKLSLELHDGPVQTIVAAEYGVEACRALLGQNQLDKVGARLDSIHGTLSQSIHDLRRIVRDLHPPALGKSGLVSAIQEYLSNLEKDDEISCRLDVRDEVARLEPSAERGIYYVVREAITNIRKHARATEVSIIIECREGNLALQVSDNGRGFDASHLEDIGLDHVGLRSMGERARMLNGQIEIISQPGNGTRIRLTVPVADSCASHP